MSLDNEPENDSSNMAAATEDQSRELVRHFRNVLAVVRVLARQTSDGVLSSAEDCARLAARIDAFARVQSVLVSDITAGADLEGLVRDELMAFGIRVEGPIRAEGPPVRLKARAAGLIALFIHELALGAAEEPSNGFSVVWRDCGDDGAIELIWEDGSAEGAHFGWLEQAFHYELKASLTVKTDNHCRRWIASLPSANLLRRIPGRVDPGL